MSRFRILRAPVAGHTNTKCVSVTSRLPRYPRHLSARLRPKRTRFQFMNCIINIDQGNRKAAASSEIFIRVSISEETQMNPGRH